MFGNRLAHRMARLRIFGGVAQAAFGQPHPARGDIDTPQFQPAGGLEKALPFDPADQLIGRNAIILHHQLCAVDRLVAQLVELLAGAETVALVGDEQAHALVARIGGRIGLGEQGKAMAVERVGNPGLCAVKDVIAACILARHGADRLQIGARIGLGQGQPAANLASSEFGQPLGLLLRRAEPLNRRRHDQVRVKNAGDRHPVARNAHHDLGIGGRRQAQSAIFLPDGRAEQPHFRHLGHQFGRPDIIVIVMLDHRDHFAFEPAVDRIHEGAFFVGVDGADLVCDCCGSCHGKVLAGCQFSCRARRSRASTPVRCACNGQRYRRAGSLRWSCR